METHLRNYTGLTNALNKAALKEFEESKWLADTLTESGQLKIRNEFEIARKALEKKLTEIERVRRWANTYLQDHHHAAMPVQEEEPIGVDPPEPLPDLVKAFDEARLQTDQRLRRLQSAVKPWFLLWPAILSYALVVAAGVFFAAYRLRPQSPVETRAVWVGAALGVLTGILIAAWVLMRRRVPAKVTDLAHAFADAKQAGERCLRRAQADRDRQSTELLAKRDEEIKKAERGLAAAKREVARRSHVGATRLRDRHARRLADLRIKSDDEMEAMRLDHEKRHRQLAAERDGRKAKAQGERAAALQELEDLDRSERGIVEQHWKQGIADIQREAAAIQSTMADLCPAWSDPAWSSFRGREEVPPAVCLGRIDADMGSLPGGMPQDERMKVSGPTAFSLPALLDLFDKGSLFIRAGKDPASAAEAVRLLKDVMLRLLTTFPPGKVRFTIIDPIGLGQNFAGFMHLADYDEQLVGGKIWTEPKHIEQRLTDLTEHIETVIQKYLRNEYDSIQEYNRQAGEVAEPYRFLVISDFPAHLTEAAAKRLASIAQSGARCGLYTLIATGPAESKARPPAWVPMAALEQSSAVLAWREGRFIWEDEVLSKWPMTPEAPPDEERLTAILHRVGAAAKDASRVQVAFEFVAPKPDQLWSQESSHEVRVALGRAGAKALQYLTLGRGTAQHALIAGRTGSGKSTLLHVLITNLALWYSPDEIEMYLVDFKKGVEFKTYASHVLPHARVVAVESEREFGLSVLRRLDAELTRRGQLFREVEVQDVAGYRKRPDAKPLPRVLLIVDEFQEFFVEDDKLAQEASLLLDRLVRQGRAFGMHVVLGSQTLGGAYSIARSTIGQMAVRIALQCSEADSYLIMSEDNAAPRLLSRPGEAIYNDVSGRIEGNSLFQIVWLPEDKRDHSLQTVFDRVRANGHVPPPPPIVFEGNVPASLSANRLLVALLDGGGDGPVPRAWLGEAISIKDPTAASFRRQSGGNLLIVGQQEDAVAALLTSACLSLAAHSSARLLLLDATPADSPHAATLEGLAAGVGAKFFRPRDAAGAVGDAFMELERREKADQHDAPPVYLVVCGLHRVRDLRKEDEFGFSSGGGEGGKTPAQQFAYLLREGPPLGVHTLVWCDTATNVERALDRNSLREFDNRVLFQMSASDSTQLIDVPTASTLGRNRALLHTEESGAIEKFRPYALPDAAWLKDALARLNRQRAIGPGTGRNV